jgi:6-phosphogluconolactonase (cycloisomerase 2 family)
MLGSALGKAVRCQPFTLWLLLGLWLVPAPGQATFPVVQQTICDQDTVLCASGIDGLRAVRGVAISPDDLHVYTCSTLADAGGDPTPQSETLSAWVRSLVDGTLTLVDQEIEDSGGVTTLAGCRGVAVSPDGKHVYTAALVDSAVTWFSRNSSTGALTFTTGDSASGGPMSGYSGANAVVVSPDGAHVYLASRSDDAVLAFSRDSSTGDLTEIDSEFDEAAGVDGLDAAEAIAVSSDGKSIYVASENDNAVAVFARDTSTGRLTFVEAQRDGFGGVDGLDLAGGVALDPAGENVYVASSMGPGGGDWAAVFSRNASTGALTFLQSLKEEDFGNGYVGCFGIGVENAGAAVSPDGLFVYLTNPWRGAVATFSRSGVDGTLSFVDLTCDDAFESTAGAVNLVLSADGENGYVVAPSFEKLVTVSTACNSSNVDLTLSTASVSTAEMEDACRSITVGPDYDVLAAGDVTLTAPRVIFNDGVSILGTLSAASAVP